MNKIYLCGGMGGRITKDVLNERKRASQLCRKHSLAAIDPGYSESPDWTQYRISDSLGRAKMGRYVAKDLKLIRRSDAVLVLTGDTPSDGSWEEKAYARFIGLPVACVAPARACGKLMGFTNVLYPCFKTTEQAIKYLKRRLR